MECSTIILQQTCTITLDKVNIALWCIFSLGFWQFCESFLTFGTQYSTVDAWPTLIWCALFLNELAALTRFKLAYILWRCSEFAVIETAKYAILATHLTLSIYPVYLVLFTDYTAVQFVWLFCLPNGLREDPQYSPECGGTRQMCSITMNTPCLFFLDHILMLE